jgi:hypothetical protein
MKDPTKSEEELLVRVLEVCGRSDPDDCLRVFTDLIAVGLVGHAPDEAAVRAKFDGPERSASTHYLAAPPGGVMT